MSLSTYVKSDIYRTPKKLIPRFAGQHGMAAKINHDSSRLELVDMNGDRMELDNGASGRHNVFERFSSALVFWR